MSRAAVFTAFGDPDVVHVIDVDDPEPGPGEAAVRVRAAGLNPMDSKIRKGIVPWIPAEFPIRFGTDLAGTVVAIGAGAVYHDGIPVAVGDEVLGWAPGSVAERVVVPASDLTLRPDQLRVETAGALTVAGLAAQNCIDELPVGRGDTVLVGGATGAVGLLYSQLAIARGARVVGTGGPHNTLYLQSIHVTPVQYGPRLAERVRSEGITAVVDAHGRDALDAGIALGVPKDRILGIADFAAIEELGVASFSRKPRSITALAHLADEIAARRIDLPISAVFLLDRVPFAFDVLEGHHNPGKIVVAP